MAIFVDPDCLMTTLARFQLGEQAIAEFELGRTTVRIVAPYHDPEEWEPAPPAAWSGTYPLDIRVGGSPPHGLLNVTVWPQPHPDGPAWSAGMVLKPPQFGRKVQATLLKANDEGALARLRSYQEGSINLSWEELQSLHRGMRVCLWSDDPDFKRALDARLRFINLCHRLADALITEGRGVRNQGGMWDLPRGEQRLVIGQALDALETGTSPIPDLTRLLTYAEEAMVEPHRYDDLTRPKFYTWEQWIESFELLEASSPDIIYRIEQDDGVLACTDFDLLVEHLSKWLRGDHELAKEAVIKGAAVFTRRERVPTNLGRPVHELDGVLWALPAVRADLQLWRRVFPTLKSC